MSDPKYTSGPWKFWPGSGIIENELRECVAKLHSGGEPFNYEDGFLISAAPEMFEVVEDATVFLEFYLSDCRERDARIAERDGYKKDYVSGHTQNVYNALQAARGAYSKAKGGE
jgi:hypothetical protein